MLRCRGQRVVRCCPDEPKQVCVECVCYQRPVQRQGLLVRRPQPEGSRPGSRRSVDELRPYRSPMTNVRWYIVSGSRRPSAGIRIPEHNLWFGVLQQNSCSASRFYLVSILNFIFTMVIVLLYRSIFSNKLLLIDEQY